MWCNTPIRLLFFLNTKLRYLFTTYYTFWLFLGGFYWTNFFMKPQIIYYNKKNVYMRISWFFFFFTFHWVDGMFLWRTIQRSFHDFQPIMKCLRYLWQAVTQVKDLHSSSSSDMSCNVFLRRLHFSSSAANWENTENTHCTMW